MAASSKASAIIRWRSIHRSGSAARSLPAHADVHLSNRNGTRQLDAAARLSANFRRFDLATAVHYTRQLGSSAGPPAQQPQTTVDVIGSGRIGDVRLRGGTTFEVTPSARLRTAEIEAYWSASENVDWDAGLAYEATAHRARARLSYVRRLSSLAVALTGEAASDGSVAFGVNLNFSLDAAHRFNLSRQPIAQAGAVRALVYRDLNDNGVRDPGEPSEKDAVVTTGTQQAEKPTDSNGAALVAGLAPFQPVAVGIDVTSLADPMLVPKKALQVVVPRPGIPAEVQIGLVGGGDVEGALVKSGGAGSKASISSWWTPAARSSPGPAPTMTVSSCSNALPMAPTPSALPGIPPKPRRFRRSSGCVSRSAPPSRSSASARSGRCRWRASRRWQAGRRAHHCAKR